MYCPVLPRRVLFCPVGLSCLALGCPVLSCLVLSCHAEGEGFKMESFIIMSNLSRSRLVVDKTEDRTSEENLDDTDATSSSASSVVSDGSDSRLMLRPSIATSSSSRFRRRSRTTSNPIFPTLRQPEERSLKRFQKVPTPSWCWSPRCTPG